MHLSSTKNESEVPGSGLTIRNIYREDTINQPSFQVFTINTIYYYFKAYFKIELAFTLSREQASKGACRVLPAFGNRRVSGRSPPEKRKQSAGYREQNQSTKKQNLALNTTLLNRRAANHPSALTTPAVQPRSRVVIHIIATLEH